MAITRTRLAGLLAGLLGLLGLLAAALVLDWPRQNLSPVGFSPGELRHVTTTLERYQTIEGWGTSLEFWTDPAIVQDARWQDAFLDLGLNILRVNMLKDVLHTPDGRLDVAIPLAEDVQANFQLMDFEIDAVRLFGEAAQWLTQNALEPERVRIVGSMWTAPHWMKGPTGRTQSYLQGAEEHPTPWLTGNEFENLPQGTGSSIGGRLRTEDDYTLRQYGSYVATWVAGFEQAYGVQIDAISMQNESTFENPFDSMTLNVDADFSEDYSQYALALGAVREAWRRNEIDTRIMAPHMAHIGPDPGNPWGLVAQMRLIGGIVDAPDSTLIDFVDYFNSNYYVPADEGGALATAGYYRGSSQVKANWPRRIDLPGIADLQKRVWFSESSGEGREWLDRDGRIDERGAATVAIKVFNALVHANAVAYVYWLFVHSSDADLDQSLLGLADLDSPRDSMKFSALRHFSRFIRPGATRIGASFGNESPSILGASAHDTLHGLSIAAFLHEQDRTLCYVLLNMTADSQTVTIALPDAVLVPAFDSYETSATARFHEAPAVEIESGVAEVTMLPFSIVTLTGELPE